MIDEVPDIDLFFLFNFFPRVMDGAYNGPVRMVWETERR